MGGHCGTSACGNDTFSPLNGFKGCRTGLSDPVAGRLPTVRHGCHVSQNNSRNILVLSSSFPSFASTNDWPAEEGWALFLVRSTPKWCSLLTSFSKEHTSDDAVLKILDLNFRDEVSHVMMNGELMEWCMCY